ncbi:MAG: hypothetical protein JWO33_1616, partial [Caulobacteraceae bacterium]|nr:hypothetical protein [Caulobacteraceae bacterium]
MTMSLQELSDREELRILMATIAQSGDIADMDAYVGCFTENGVLELPMFKAEGRANIIKSLSGNPEGRRARKVVRHNITSSKMTLTSPTTASGRSYYLVYYGPGPDHMGHYEDLFEKVDGAWLLA